MRKNQYKTIFFILLILIISISLIYLIQPTPNNCNYSTNKNKIVDITEKNKVDNNLENLLTSDNPGNFFLTTDKNVVYEGGNITFFWTASEGADNYSLYVSTKNITEIDGNCLLITEGLTKLNYSIKASESGIRYYVVVAYNESGNTISNCVKITIVEIEDSDGNGDYATEALSGPLIIILIIGIVFILSITAIVRYREKKRHVFGPQQEPISYIEKDEHKQYKRFVDEDSQSFNKPKSAIEIINELINNERLLNSINQEKDLEKSELSFISMNFLNKVDKFRWTDESQKVEFIREMLALTPKERDDIISYMMERSKKEDLSL
jgi:hypothetical protein